MPAKCKDTARYQTISCVEKNITHFPVVIGDWRPLSPGEENSPNSEPCSCPLLNRNTEPGFLLMKASLETGGLVESCNADGGPIRSWDNHHRVVVKMPLPFKSNKWPKVGHDRSVWEWMYLTICPPRGPGHDSSVGEWMNLTVCPPCGPGHDSSVGEWMYLTVYPPCGPGHDSSVREWMYLTVLPMARVQFPAMVEYFNGLFPSWSHSANPSWASVAENGSISPQRYHTTCGKSRRKAAVQPRTDNGGDKKNRF